MRPTVHVHQAVLDHVASLASDFPTLETGGSLFGLWTHGGSPVVSLATGPGPASRHHPTAFYQDPSHLESTHHVAWHRAGLQHIGEWHSHHSLGLAEPSHGDEQTIWRSVQDLHWPRFLLGICCFEPDTLETVDIGLFLFEAGSRTITRCDLRLLTGESTLTHLQAELPPGRVRPDLIVRPQARVDTTQDQEWFYATEVAERLAMEIRALELLSEQTGAEVSSEVSEGAVYLNVAYPNGVMVVARLTEGFPGNGIEVEVDEEPQAVEWHPDVTFATLALRWFSGTKGNLSPE